MWQRTPIWDPEIPSLFTKVVVCLGGSRLVLNVYGFTINVIIFITPSLEGI